MKLLVVSHACVTPINQRFYADVGELTKWEMTLVLPSTWSTSYESHMRAERSERFTGSFRPVPVWKAGNVPLHLYKNAMTGILREVRPDAIYMHHEPYGAATFQLCLANSVRGNVPIGFYAAQNIEKKYPPPFRWIEQHVYARSGFAFPCSVGALDVLRRKGYKGTAEVLPLPVELNLYKPMPEWAAATRAERGIGADEFVIGYLGRLVEEKGLKTLLRALAAGLPAQGWRCVLVGGGPLEAELRQLAAELGIADRILFTGFVPHEQAAGWYSLFDVFVLPSETRPSWKEQFGRVIIEANACETAVIGTESGEIGNVLRSTGGGLIVPEANHQELGRAILALMSNPAQRRELAVKGAQVVRKQYNQTHLAGRFAAVIENAVQNRAGRRNG